MTSKNNSAAHKDQCFDTNRAEMRSERERGLRIFRTISVGRSVVVLGTTDRAVFEEFTPGYGHLSNLLALFLGSVSGDLPVDLSTRVRY